MFADNKKTNNGRCSKRACYGGTIPEFAGVFMVFILMIFLPLIDVVTMAAIYGAGASLNFDSCREASMVANQGSTSGAFYTQVSDPETVREERVKKSETIWKSSGIGSFVNLAAPLKHSISVIPAASKGADEYVRVTTVVSANPFLTVPFPVTVSGLNAPMTFTYMQERLVEE